MPHNERNYAFIDSQNLYRGIKSLGWQIDWHRFRTYLKDKYSVVTAYMFIGYLPENAPLYAELQQAGFLLVFKPVLVTKTGDVKGNVDADLVLYAMTEYQQYDRAIIVSSDGDFYSLVNHLYVNSKLEAVLSPYGRTCSILLKKTAKERLQFMDTLQKKIGKLP